MSLKRLQKFLDNDELDSDAVQRNTHISENFVLNSFVIFTFSIHKYEEKEKNIESSVFKIFFPIGIIFCA